MYFFFGQLISNVICNWTVIVTPRTLFTVPASCVSH